MSDGLGKVAALAVTGANAASKRRQMSAALAGRGYTALDDADAAPPSAPGVVLFERMADDVCALVSRLSQGSRRRVIAVSLAPDGLEGSAPWELLAAGAADALSWKGAATARELAARFERWREVDTIVDSPLIGRNLVGEDNEWRTLIRSIVEVAAFSRASVVITGESGTGKELVARLVHALDRRPDKGQLVVVDCTTVVPTLSGSEFFGHERGAFTGAVADREGAFALADKGTLFLDEVGDLPMTLQAELLRVVQEGTYKRVGSSRWLRTSFRLVCATNRDLIADQDRGTFRRDFYYRIAGWTCSMPSLRDRRGDIPVLAQHFLDELGGKDHLELDQPLTDYLTRREYPGNVRELRQLVVRLSHHHVGKGPITAGALPLDERATAAAIANGNDSDSMTPSDGTLSDAVEQAVSRGVGLKELVAQTRDAAISAALDAEGGNVRAASRRLGVTDRAIHMHRAAHRNGQ